MTLTLEQENVFAREMQAAFPLHQTPFAELAARLGHGEHALLEVATRWQREHKLREISAILEGQALGYQSALVAGEVPHADLERVAALVNEHPTVTHNYERTHAYNLWFTVAVPSRMGLDATLQELAARAGVAKFWPLGRTSTFKIGVNFDLLQKKSLTPQLSLQAVCDFHPSPVEERMFRALQTPLALALRPFDALADHAGVTTGELLAFANAHLGGAMRRYVATFHHRSLGVRGNGMVVWEVPERDHARIGALLASAPEVSHCYARSTIPGFPYTVYSMVHGPDEAAVSAVAARLSEQTGVRSYLALFSTREFKKCRLRYFLPELDAWWSRRGSAGKRPALSELHSSH